MRRVLVINGPNLNLLGTRETGIYGHGTLEDLDRQVAEWGSRMGIDVVAFQSNHEGALIDRIHEARHEVDGIVINGGALTHYSYALHDALVAVALPSVEVHLSNIHAREPWRAVSVTGPASLRTIFGRGPVGYRDGIRALVNLTEAPPEEIPYGDDPEQVIDVRRPEGDGRHPAAVLLHGGFWRHEWSRDTIDSLAVDLHRRGWLTANVEYRRLGVGGAWPTPGEDVLAAIAAVAGRDDVDVSRIVLVGHSAGGHLALFASRWAPAATVVGLAPLSDLARALELDLGDGSVREVFADTGAAAADPTTDPPRVPQIIVHGTGDTKVPIELSSRYVEAARTAGAAVEYVTPDTGHFELLDPRSEVWEDVVAILER